MSHTEGPKVGIENLLGLSKIVRQKFLDIGQHPAYKEVALDSERGVAGLLPCGVDNILVRPAYERILERAETLSRRYPTSTLRPPPIRNMFVSGVPGIGKESCQIILLMLINGQAKAVSRTILLPARKTTVIQPYRVKGRGYLRFDAAGVSFVPANSDEELDSVCWNRDVWALIDDYPLHGFGDPRMYSWMFLWTASPNKHETSTWRKEASAELQFIDGWCWSEIAALR